MDPVRKARWQTTALIALIFVLGFISGQLVRSAQHQRELRDLLSGDVSSTRTQLIVRALDRSLSLTNEQRNTAQRLLQEQEVAFRAAVEPCRSQVAALRETWLHSLRAELTAEQQTELDTLLAQRRQLLPDAVPTP
jgi:hypothetical protein